MKELIEDITLNNLSNNGDKALFENYKNDCLMIIENIVNSDIFYRNDDYMVKYYQKNTRENYHKLKKYTDVNSEPKEKEELARVKKLYDENENKIYDINQVLEEARKNSLNAEEESKRKTHQIFFQLLFWFAQLQFLQ